MNHPIKTLARAFSEMNSIHDTSSSSSSGLSPPRGAPKGLLKGGVTPVFSSAFPFSASAAPALARKMLIARITRTRSKFRSKCSDCFKSASVNRNSSYPFTLALANASTNSSSSELFNHSLTSPMLHASTPRD